MAAGSGEMRSWPCGYLGRSVRPEPDDVSRGIVVADPNLALRTSGDSAADGAGLAPDDLRIVHKRRSRCCCEGRILALPWPRTRQPRPASHGRRILHRCSRHSGCWDDGLTRPWRSDGQPSLAPPGRVDPTRRAAVHPLWRGSRYVGRGSPGPATIACGFGQAVHAVAHRPEDIASPEGAALERHWTR